MQNEKEMKTKTAKITLGGFGSYLGMEKGCFIVKNEEARAEASDITARPPCCYLSKR